MSPKKPKIALGATCAVFGHNFPSHFHMVGTTRVYGCTRCPYQRFIPLRQRP